MLDLAIAAQTLCSEFGNITRAPYVPGKTNFRDKLCTMFAISTVEAEAVCDSLERVHVLTFGRDPEEGPLWMIDPSNLWGR